MFGLSQLFVQRDANGTIILLVAKVTDELLIGGLVGDISHFNEKMKVRFQVGKKMIDKSFFFDGCEI